VRLKTDTYAQGKAAAPGWDIYVLEAEWKEWGAQQKTGLLRTRTGLIGFCRKRGRYPGTLVVRHATVIHAA
jgi:hypothetical protein